MNGDLIIFPCSGSKKGTGCSQPLPPVTVFNFLDIEGAAKLEEAREKAFQKPGVKKCSGSKRPALTLYSGHVYKIPYFKDRVWEALNKGVHCLILSGGYGLVRPEEPIHCYEAHIDKTRAVWRLYLPDLIGRYITQNNVKRVFVACSKAYAEVLFGSPETSWTQQVAQVYCYVPVTSARVTTLKLIGKAIVDLVNSGMVPDRRWARRASG